MTKRVAPIAIGSSYFNVTAKAIYDGFQAFAEANPKASTAERVAEKNRLRAQQREQNAALKANGYPTERRFQYRETADRYAREVARECGFEPSVYEQSDVFL